MERKHFKISVMQNVVKASNYFETIMTPEDKKVGPRLQAIEMEKQRELMPTTSSVVNESTSYSSRAKKQKTGSSAASSVTSSHKQSSTSATRSPPPQQVFEKRETRSSPKPHK